MRTIPDLAVRFDAAIGLSDHTLGTAVAVAGVSVGAVLIEKHFTLRRSDGGPDAAFSLEPEELATLVNDCRTAWQALGSAGYDRRPSEEPNLVFRRSLYVVKTSRKGTCSTSETSARSVPDTVSRRSTSLTCSGALPQKTSSEGPHSAGTWWPAHRLTRATDSTAMMEQPPTKTTSTPPVKLVVWDLDETLWSGTLSEGPVALDPSPRGPPPPARRPGRDGLDQLEERPHPRRVTNWSVTACGSW